MAQHFENRPIDDAAVLIASAEMLCGLTGNADIWTHRLPV